jgi:hypothetical protein
MTNKRITDVDIIDSLDSNESFFVNQNSSIKQISKNNVFKNTVFGISNGGTGASTIAGAREALGLGNTDGALPIANGGTGAVTAVEARANLGAITMASTVIELAPDGWVDNKQTINVDGVTANNVVIVNPNPETENYVAYTERGIRCIEQAEGTLTFLCDIIPSITVIVNVAVFS